MSSAQDLDRQSHTGNAAADMIGQIGANKFRNDAEKAQQEIADLKSQIESLGAEAEQAQQRRDSLSETIANASKQTPTIEETLNQQQDALNQAGPSARPVSLSARNHGGMPAEESLGSWSSYQSVITGTGFPYTQSVRISNGELSSSFHLDLGGSVTDYQHKVAVRDLDPASISLWEASSKQLGPSTVPNYTSLNSHYCMPFNGVYCVIVPTDGKKPAISGNRWNNFLDLYFPDEGSAQQAIVELGKLILKYRSLGVGSIQANQPLKPYWFAFAFSDADAPAPVATFATSSSDYDRNQAKENALASCRQQTGDFFTCHEARDVQVTRHMWVAGAQSPKGDYNGWGVGDTQDAASSKALSNCNPFGGCQISFIQELFPR